MCQDEYILLREQKNLSVIQVWVGFFNNTINYLHHVVYTFHSKHKLGDLKSLSDSSSEQLYDFGVNLRVYCTCCGDNDCAGTFSKLTRAFLLLLLKPRKHCTLL